MHGRMYLNVRMVTLEQESESRPCKPWLPDSLIGKTSVWQAGGPGFKPPLGSNIFIHFNTFTFRFTWRNVDWVSLLKTKKLWRVLYFLLQRTFSLKWRIHIHSSTRALHSDNHSVVWHQKRCCGAKKRKENALVPHTNELLSFSESERNVCSCYKRHCSERGHLLQKQKNVLVGMAEQAALCNLRVLCQSICVCVYLWW